MTFIRRLTIIVGVIGGSVLVLIGIALRLQSRPILVDTLPELENYSVEGWLGNEKLLVSSLQEKNGTKDLLAYDLKTRAISQLPSPQFLSKASRFLVSPDGHWILYKETSGGGKTGVYGSRWRLEQVDEHENRLFPHNGSFRSVAGETKFPVPPACWLHDSSGWLSVSKITKEHLEMEQFALDRPKLAPERVILPIPYPDSPLPVATTPEGNLIFANYSENHLTIYEPQSKQTQRLMLSVSGGEIDGFVTNGQQVLAAFEIPKTGVSAWIASFFHQHSSTTELWYFLVKGQRPLRLGTLPSDIAALSLRELSPNGKRALLTGDRDCIVTLP